MSPPDHDETSTLQAINAISVKLPTFSTQEPISWFRRAEVQFRLRKITDPRTKADYVLEAIPETIFLQLSAWLDQQADEITFDPLKAYLLKEYTLTVSDRAKKLLAMPSQQLGDRTALNVWNEMQSLARLPGTDTTTGLPLKVDLMRELWLQSIPTSVRAALHDADTLPMDELIKKADNLITAARAAQKPSPISWVDTTPSEDDVADINAVRQPRQQYRRPPLDRRDPDNRSGPRTYTGYMLPTGICSYHHKFGKDARNCLQGCKWSKNSDGGRRR